VYEMRVLQPLLVGAVIAALAPTAGSVRTRNSYTICCCNCCNMAITPGAAHLAARSSVYP
jgi:hypothetical protein